MASSDSEGGWRGGSGCSDQVWRSLIMSVVFCSGKIDIVMVGETLGLGIGGVAGKPKGENAVFMLLRLVLQ
jgi:coenzyme F420-reducing hydrogenase delta subunit